MMGWTCEQGGEIRNVYITFTVETPWKTAVFKTKEM
jgi:hypothetical protein